MEEALIFTPRLSHLFKMEYRYPEPAAALNAAHTTDTAASFEEVFKTNFKSLHAYACSMLRDEIMAEEMVQNVFYKLWQKKDTINIEQSLVAYLYRAVYNECLNYIKHLKVRAEYQSHAVRQTSHEDNAHQHLAAKDLKEKLDKALKELPEQCRTVFQLSRFEELKYTEIAERLNISSKTVENHMGKALKLLRIKLVDFLPAFIIILLNLQNRIL